MDPAILGAIIGVSTMVCIVTTAKLYDFCKARRKWPQLKPKREAPLVITRHPQSRIKSILPPNKQKIIKTLGSRRLQGEQFLKISRSNK